MKLIRQRDVWDLGRLGLYAFIYGVGFSIFQIAVFGTLSSAWVDIRVSIAVLSVMTFLVIPTISTWTARCQIINQKRLMGACVCASLGAALPLHAIALVNLYGATSLVLPYTLVINVILTMAWCVIAAILWPMIVRLGPFRVQDGASCPDCGYCVRGVASRICPECGRVFNEIDLGLSPAAFDSLISGDSNATTVENAR